MRAARVWISGAVALTLLAVAGSASAAAGTARPGDLPLEEVPAVAQASGWLAVHLTGDGGYGVTDKGVARELAAHGMSTVVLNSLKYFWTPRTPESTAADLARLLRYYLPAWNKQHVVLIGYSFGADVLPFVITRLPAELRDRIGLVVYIGQGRKADFHFHLTDWVGIAGRNALPVLPELEKLRGLRMESFYGEHDGGALCRDLHSDVVRCTPMDRGHAVGDDFGQIVTTILGDVAEIERTQVGAVVQ